MNIILVCNYYLPHEEGAEEKIHLATSQTMLAEKLVERGHRVVVVSRKLKGTNMFNIRNGVHVYRTSFIDMPYLKFITWFFTSMLKILILIFKYKPNIVICWDWSAVYPALICKIFGIPVICSIRGKPQGIFSEIAYNLSDYIIYSSKWIKKFIKAYKGKVLHQGIDMKIFNKNVKPLKKCQKIVIGYFGRFFEYKGIYVLVSALNSLNTEYKQKIKVIFVGDGPEKNNLMKKAKNLNIEFYETVPYRKVPRYMAMCDIIVLPSFHEGFSSVPLEAMALAKVIISSRVGGAIEIIKNWKNGIVFNPGNVDELKNIIEKLIRDKKLIKKIGISGNIFVSKKYKWEKIIKKWEEVFNEFSKN